MAIFKEITPSEITNNPFDLIGKDWALVTSGNTDKFNTMTVSWGGVGIMWGKPVTYTFIRPQRYTFEFMEANGYFSMSFFDEEQRDALKFCGSKSGRDYDKVKETGLTPAFTEDGVPYFEEAKLVLVCKKMYSQFLNEDCIEDAESVAKWYDNDYHKMYVSEITKVLVKE
ncbi:MAG: flavin reductase family protein [Ruminococcus sp.]|nr:flavin reductase family protein [Ruminococcus sp.]